MDREWGTKCTSSFGGGWAPSDHNVQALGSRNGRLAFISPCQYTLKVMAGSRLKKSPESAVSQHGSPTKRLSSTERGPGLRLVREGQGSSHRVRVVAVHATLCVKIHSCRDSLCFFLCFILCAWGCVCALNIY